MSTLDRSTPLASARIRGGAQVLLSASLLAVAGVASAEVQGASSSGFEVREQAQISAAPAAIYRTLIAPSRWWDAGHTYSRDAANLTLDARAGGCWCERLPDGGSVLHLTVVNATPGKLLRLRGGLGPLQAMGVEGSLSIKIEGSAAGSQVIFTYAVGGYSSTGFEELAKVVDKVLGEQLDRLKRVIETGHAAAAH